jgi:hypothetical protein
MNEPDNTGEVARQELEMDDWAQECWSSSLVVPERRPAPNVPGRRRCADRIPKEVGPLLRERSWYIPRWLDRLLPNIITEPPHGR